jgi:adenylate cyclase
MRQLAIYSTRQHDQFPLEGQRFVLSRGADALPWRFSPGDDCPLAPQAVQLQFSEGRLRATVRGAGVTLETAAGSAYSPSTPVELTTPCLFRLGDAWVEVRESTADAAALGLEPLHRVGTAETGEAAQRRSASLDPETVAGWLAAIGQIHRTPANSPQFYEVASRALLGGAGLDSAMILLRRPEGWQIAGSAVSQPQLGVSFVPAALVPLVDDPQVWRRPPRTEDLVAGENRTERSAVEESLVVAPVRDDEGRLVAAVYGLRHGRGRNRRLGIRPLEARFVELLADAVGAGLARRQQELESARHTALLEQAFSPQVVAHLTAHPEALSGQTREVTLLFADLRRFTAVVERLAPSVAYDVLGSVMESLTQAVVDQGGVVIDYYGDGLSAMWNAPVETPRHAELACAAAMTMLDAMPELSARWRGVAAEPLSLCVGIHTGEVRVGNAGTRRRMKYGPRGAAVHIASRVQGAAKQLDVALLATDAVRRKLSSKFTTLKVCTARLAGLEEPLELFSVFPAADGKKLQGELDRYAEALGAFERGDLDAAEAVLADLLERGPATPAEFLAGQTAALRQAALGRRATDQFGCTPDAVIEFLAK